MLPGCRRGGVESRPLLLWVLQVPEDVRQRCRLRARGVAQFDPLRPSSSSEREHSEKPRPTGSRRSRDPPPGSRPQLDAQRRRTVQGPEVKCAAADPMQWCLALAAGRNASRSSRWTEVLVLLPPARPPGWWVMVRAPPAKLSDRPSVNGHGSRCCPARAILCDRSGGGPVCVSQLLRQPRSVPRELPRQDPDRPTRRRSCQS